MSWAVQRAKIVTALLISRLQRPTKLEAGAKEARPAASVDLAHPPHSRILSLAPGTAQNSWDCTSLEAHTRPIHPTPAPQPAFRAACSSQADAFPRFNGRVCQAQHLWNRLRGHRVRTRARSTHCTLRTQPGGATTGAPAPSTSSRMEQLETPLRSSSLTPCIASYTRTLYSSHTRLALATPRPLPRQRSASHPLPAPAAQLLPFPTRLARLRW